MNERRRYRNPPIEEALCEFRFLPSREWDLTIPGKFHLSLGDEYSGKPQEQKVVDIALNAEAGQPPKMSYGEGLAKVQLVTKDGKRQVGIGKDVLSVHMLRPYQDPSHPDRSGWDEFQPRISAALDAYWKVAKPIGVLRIGIRYINKIVIPQKAVEVKKYLRCALPVVSGFPEQLRHFMSRVDYADEDDIRIVLSQGSINAPQDHVGFLLDLDVIWESGDAISQDEALLRAGNLRDRERTAFEAVITNRARELFDAN